MGKKNLLICFFYFVYSGNMRKINGLRARLIHSDLKSDSCTAVTTAIETFLRNCPSYIESTSCRNKGCISRQQEVLFPFVQLNDDVFNNNWANLEEAIMADLKPATSCPKCKKNADNFTRTFGEHLLIQVIISPFIYQF